MEQLRVSDTLCKQAAKLVVIDRAIVFRDVDLADIHGGRGAEELLDSSHCFVGAFVGTASVRVVDEMSFVKWAENAMEGMMYDSISECRCFDVSYFRLGDEAFSVWKGGICASGELLLNSE